MSRFSFARLGTLLLTVVVVGSGHSAHAQIASDRESAVEARLPHQTNRLPSNERPRLSPSQELPSWAEPDPSSTPKTNESVSTKANPGLPDEPTQDVPIGGGGGTALLLSAGVGYAIRRLYCETAPS